MDLNGMEWVGMDVVATTTQASAIIFVIIVQ